MKRRIAVILAALAASMAAPTLVQAGPLRAILITQPLSWEGEATVYPPGKTLKISVRTRIDKFGNVVSESWPVDVGEAKGLRRMTMSADGGTIERGGREEPMPYHMWQEERAQFQFYQLLQVAQSWAPQRAGAGATVFSVAGHARTWFRISPDGTIVGAMNEVPTAQGKAYQAFRFAGFLKSADAIFPKHMEMTRDGKPYFTLDVTQFDAL